MAENWKFRPNLDCWRISQNDPGWIYDVRTGELIKIGKTKDPARRLFREARTWSPEELEVIGVKPFWNIGRIEYWLHCALAEFWYRGEWHKFNEAYWMDLFLNGFRAFEDDEEGRGANSVNFHYWFNGDNYAEALRTKREYKMSLSAWRRCHGDPWAHLRQKQAHRPDPIAITPN